MIVTNETMALAHEILAYWLRFNKHDQSQWVGDDLIYSENLIGTSKVDGKEYNVCKTTMCAAGTAVFLSETPGAFTNYAKEATFYDWMDRGGYLLGLTSEEAHKVFMSDNKSAKRFMRAIASGSQKKFKKAWEKSVEMEDV